jgi:hypothetical protein
MEQHWYVALLVPILLCIVFTTIIQAGVLLGVARLFGIEDITFGRAYGAYWVMFLIDGFAVWFFGKALDGVLAGLSTTLLCAWFLSYFFSTGYGRALGIVIISQIILLIIGFIAILILGLGFATLLQGLGSSSVF